MRQESQKAARSIGTSAWLLALALTLGGCANSGQTREAEDNSAATEASSTTTASAAETAASGTRSSAGSSGSRSNPGSSNPGVTREDLAAGHPIRYTVREGDTLWDIAARFLEDPWVWPEIWTVNPEIANPHLIFPGDVIRLTWADAEPRLAVDRPESEEYAEPRLEVERPDREIGIRKLEPEIRRLPIDEAIDAIPSDAIRTFLNRPRVVTPEQMEAAPYILASRDDRVLMSEGDEVFARGLNSSSTGAYMIFRLGEELVDPDTNETLGWEAIHTGDARVTQLGDPARVRITSSQLEIREGDRLLPLDDFVRPGRYIPITPEEPIEGRIVGLIDAIARVATNQIVVINHGERDGIEVGTILGVEQGGAEIQDRFSGVAHDTVQLPTQRVGTLMVFRTFEHVSYALIMSSIRPIRMHDHVTNP